MKSIRKGAIVECIGDSKEKMKVWGTRFKVYHKEGDFVRLESLEKPWVGMCGVIPVKNVKLVEA